MSQLKITYTDNNDKTIESNHEYNEDLTIEDFIIQCFEMYSKIGYEDNVTLITSGIDGNEMYNFNVEVDEGLTTSSLSKTNTFDKESVFTATLNTSNENDTELFSEEMLGVLDELKARIDGDDNVPFTFLDVMKGVDVIAEGATAQSNGESYNNNPYPETEVLHKHWNFGWSAGNL